MKLFLLLVTGLLLLFIGYFSYLSYLSHQQKIPGLTNHRLSTCPNSPNCINSEYPEDSLHFVEPLSFAIHTEAEILTFLETAIKQTGGNVISIKTNYIAAIYTSSLFRFVDNFEIRVDTQTKKIHFRSASRQGHSDMGVNLKRVNEVKRIFLRLSENH